MERGKILLREIDAYEKRFPGEDGLIQAMRSFICSREEAISRECLHGHITGSAFVTTNDFSKVLLLYHKKLRLWVQPGGHCEAGETVYGHL